MAVGQSDEVEPMDAIAAAIGECKAALGDLRPQAGILFSAFDSFDPSIVAALREAFPDATVVGSTSAAEISSPGGYQEDSITLAMFASDMVDITAGLGTGLGLDVDAACRAAAAQAIAATDREPKVCIMLAEGFAARSPDDARRHGPRAAGRRDHRRRNVGRPRLRIRAAVLPVLRGDVVTDDGVAILLFSGPISRFDSVGTGWRTLGATGTVTGSTSGAVLRDRRPTRDRIPRRAISTSPARRRSGTRWPSSRPAVDESYYRAVMGTDPAIGLGRRGGRDPGRCRSSS